MDGVWTPIGIAVVPGQGPTGGPRWTRTGITRVPADAGNSAPTPKPASASRGRFARGQTSWWAAVESNHLPPRCLASSAVGSRVGGPRKWRGVIRPGSSVLAGRFKHGPVEARSEVDDAGRADPVIVVALT